jgi:N-acetylmuramoyl-L-alanine amidase
MLKRPFTVTAGHSDQDPGAIHFGFKEEELMQELRDIVALKLRQKGHQVVTDGARGFNESLTKAIRLIVGSSAAIELHTNGHTNGSATGVEVIALPKDKLLAQSLAKGIGDVLGIPLRGDRGWIDQSQSHRGKLGFVSNGGLVVETFFLSNVRDLAVYQTKKWLVAQAIADVLDDF